MQKKPLIFDAKKSARCSRVLVETELIVSGSQCISLGVKGSLHITLVPITTSNLFLVRKNVLVISGPRCK